MHLRTSRAKIAAAILGLLIAGRSVQAQAVADRTAFDDYIEKPDATYRWELADTVKGEKATTYIIDLTSQTWRTTKDVDRPVWKHWLVIVVPAEVKKDTAFIMVSGGANDGKKPKGADPRTQAIAYGSNTVVAELRMIPNQPLVFHGDGVPRKEDDLIGYCWDQYLKTGDPTWMPRFPMVKSVVRAMDCIQEFTASEKGGGKKIERFVVGGGSKRGWTTWLTGIADRRVRAIVPIVIDVANVDVSMRHHAAVYGFWAEAIGDYYVHGLMSAWKHPRLAEMYALVDPYRYRNRLTLPKYVVNASGDQFFVPDSSQFYYGELKGEKLLRYVPNGDHSLRDTDALESIIAYYHMILEDKPRPTLDWTFEQDGSIQLTCQPKPISVTLWQANNPNARDFRLETIGPAFQGSEVQANAEGKFVAKVDKPQSGWTAYYLEAAFESGWKHPLKASTGVRITPDRKPFEHLDPSKVPYEGRKPRKRA